MFVRLLVFKLQDALTIPNKILKITDYDVTSLNSVNGQYASQGKLGAAVLANHSANDVSIKLNI